MDKRVTLTSLLSNKTYSHTHTQSYMQCDTMSMKNLVRRQGLHDKPNHTLVSQVTLTR